MDLLGLEHLASFVATQQKAADEAKEKLKRPEVIDALCTPERLAVFADGEWKTVERPIPTRKHRVLTIADFADAVRRWGGDESTVFIDLDGFHLVVDDNYRLDRVTMPIFKSEAYQQVSAIANGTTFEHQGLLHLLRTDLRDVLEDDGRELLARARAIKFKRSNAGHSALGNTGASMGQSVEMELLGVEGQELPDLFHVFVPVFMYPAPDDVKERIRIDVTTDFANATFRLAVNADEIQRAVIHALQELRGKFFEAIGDDFPAGRVLLGSL